MEEAESDQLYHLGEKLKHESHHRLHQEAVNSRLITEQTLLRKKLAEAELHIDRMRFGVNVDINKRFILSHETKQCVTLQQKLEAQGPSTHSDDPGSWPGPLIPCAPVPKEEGGKEKYHVTVGDGESDVRATRESQVICEETREGVGGAFPPPPGRNNSSSPSQRQSKEPTVSTQYEEHLHASSTPLLTLLTPTTFEEKLHHPYFSEDEPHQATDILTCSEKSQQASTSTAYEKQFHEKVVTSRLDKEGSSSLFFSNITPPDHFSHNTSVSEEYDYSTSPPPLLNLSDTNTDRLLPCKKDIPSSNLDEQAILESHLLSQVFRIHNLLEKIASLKNKSFQERYTVEELFDGLQGILLEHEKLVSDIGKPGQVLTAMEMKHERPSEGSREALKEVVSVIVTAQG